MPNQLSKLLAQYHPLVAKTMAQYPTLQPYLSQIAFKDNPAQDGRMLEYYPKGETDSFDPSRNAVEVFGGRASPQDLAGDLVSHQLANGENTQLGRYFSDFVQSMTPKQKAILQEQYQWAKDKEGETRPYDQWAQASGLPAYFRGYAFNQWPGRQDMYTPQQIQQFDQMNRFLKSRTGGGD